MIKQQIKFLMDSLNPETNAISELLINPNKNKA